MLSACKPAPPAEPLPFAAPEPETVNSEPINIKWGYGFGLGDAISQLRVPSKNAVTDALIEEFGVSLEPMFTLNGVINENDPPDFFMSGDARLLYESGVTRAVPRTFITQHAPRYSALLDSEARGWDLGRAPGQDAYIGLSIYDDNFNRPRRYAAYRLDWLEDFGFAVNGAVHELDRSSRFYFTDAAFTQNQFVEIIDVFARRNPEAGGLLVPAQLSEAMDLTLAGMFGLNDAVVNEGGAAVPYYASSRYRDYLQFLSGMQANGLLIVSHNPFSGSQPDIFSINPPEFVGGLVGWTNYEPFVVANYDMIMPDVVNIFSSYYNPDAKILITPPEIGASRLQGVSAPGAPFFKDRMWLVSKNADDAKLAAILRLFDALSFDPQTLALARYGFAGEDFTWEGEPYDSRVIQSQQGVMQAIHKGALMYFTYVQDGNAWKTVYDLGDNALTDFALSAAARRMLIRPYKDDLSGLYTDRARSLDTEYGAGLAQTAQEFYLSVVTGQTDDVAAGWDAYMTALTADGLNEYIDLYASYALVDNP